MHQPNLYPDNLKRLCLTGNAEVAKAKNLWDTLRVDKHAAQLSTKTRDTPLEKLLFADVEKHLIGARSILDSYERIHEDEFLLQLTGDFSYWQLNRSYDYLDLEFRDKFWEGYTKARMKQGYVKARKVILDPTHLVIKRTKGSKKGYKGWKYGHTKEGKKPGYSENVFLDADTGQPIYATHHPGNFHPQNEIVEKALRVKEILRKGYLLVIDAGLHDIDDFIALKKEGIDILVRAGDSILVKPKGFRKYVHWQKLCTEYRIPVKHYKGIGNIYSAIVQLKKGQGMKFKLAIVERMKGRKVERYALLTNRVKMSPYEMAITYKGRWSIETTFDEAKNDILMKLICKYGFDGVGAHAFVALLAYSLLAMMTPPVGRGKQRAWKLVDHVIRIVGEVYRADGKLLIYARSSTCIFTVVPPPCS